MTKSASSFLIWNVHSKKGWWLQVVQSHVEAYSANDSFVKSQQHASSTPDLLSSSYSCMCVHVCVRELKACFQYLIHEMDSEVKKLLEVQPSIDCRMLSRCAIHMYI